MSEDFLANAQGDDRAGQRCLLTKPATITATSKNQQEKHIPAYSKGIRSQSKLNPRKPQQRNPIASPDLRPLSRLYWVLQIPGLPWKAIKFLALLGATKALARRKPARCTLAESAAWQTETTAPRGANFPHLTRWGVRVRAGPPRTAPLSCIQAASWGWGSEDICRAPSQPGKKNPFPHQEAVQAQPARTVPITQQDRVPFLTPQRAQKP